jgi:hypothetical protein
VATTAAVDKAAWLEASLTLYWQEELTSTSTQKGQALSAPAARDVVVTVEDTPPVYFIQ